MSDTERTVEVCECEKCGNESEMVVTCKTIVLKAEDDKGEESEQTRKKKSFTCKECGYLTETVTPV